MIAGGKAFRLGSGIDEHKQRSLLSTLCRFLNENDLVLSTLPMDEAHDWEGFTLRHSNLNTRGLALVKAGLPRWLAAIDRGTPVTKTTVLERALQKLNTSNLGK